MASPEIHLTFDRDTLVLDGLRPQLLASLPGVAVVERIGADMESTLLALARASAELPP